MADHHTYHRLMLRAVELGRGGFGRTAPNPCVGALIVRDGAVLAQGWHQAYGGPHAERVALADAAAKGVPLGGCTLLVTLEPCNHYGKTPPCTEAILESGIRHVVIGAMDPNPVAAGGAERLRAAGLTVETGVAERECLDSLKDFLHFRSGSKLPYVLLKLASTLDGRIATRSGESRWVSSPASRARVHWLRERVQAVMVGAGTFVLDNPRLEARADLLGHEPEAQPLAVVFCSKLPENNSRFDLLRERAESTIFFTSPSEADSAGAEALRGRGVTVYGLAGENGRPDLARALEFLRSRHDCRYVMCEGGGRLGLEFLRRKLAGEFLLFMAPKALGDDQARPLFSGLEPRSMDEALRLRIAGSEMVGGDLCVRLFED